MKFSERIGAVRRVLQKESMDEALTHALWKVAYRRFWRRTVNVKTESVPRGPVANNALSDEPTVNGDDAKFFLASCSAFVNYVIAKSVLSSPTTIL